LQLFQPAGCLLPVILSEAKNPVGMEQHYPSGFFASLRMTESASLRMAKSASLRMTNLGNANQIK
jgi:hypothetical protein